MNTNTKILLGVVIAVALAYMANEFLQRSAGSSSLQDSGALVTPSGENFVINGDFDLGVDAWRTDEAWPVEWSSAEGNGSVRVTAISENASKGRGVFSQCIGITGNQTYELGGSFKKDRRSTQSGGGRLRVSWYEQLDCAGDGKIDPRWVSPQDELGWQQLRAGGLAAPPNAQSGRVSIIQTVDGSGEFTAYWDNLYLKATQ